MARQNSTKPEIPSGEFSEGVIHGGYFRSAGGFIWTQIYRNLEMNETNYPGMKALIDTLIDNGENVVLYYPSSWYKSEHYLSTPLYRGHALALYSSIQTRRGENKPAPNTWKGILEVATHEMNEYRREYNWQLERLRVVTSLTIKHASTAMTLKKIKQGWLLLLSSPLQVNEFFKLYAVQEGSGKTDEHFTYQGKIQRIAKNGTVFALAQNGETLILTFVDIDKQPLSMLSEENVMNERVLIPKPFINEPTIP